MHHSAGGRSWCVEEGVSAVLRGACGGHVWEGEPFASKSPGNRTRPPAVTPYRPYSRCGTDLIECAESARGRRAERGEVSCRRNVCRGDRCVVTHETSVSAYAGTMERTGSRVEVVKHTGLSSCDRLRGHGPGGMRAFGSMGMCHGETSVRIGSDRCVSSATM